MRPADAGEGMTDWGVLGYWVVDPGEGVVRIWDQTTGSDAPRELRDTVRWRFPEGAEPLEIAVGELVAPI